MRYAQSINSLKLSVVLQRLWWCNFARTQYLLVIYLHIFYSVLSRWLTSIFG